MFSQKEATVESVQTRPWKPGKWNQQEAGRRIWGSDLGMIRFDFRPAAGTILILTEQFVLWGHCCECGDQQALQALQVPLADSRAAAVIFWIKTLILAQMAIWIKIGFCLQTLNSFNVHCSFFLTSKQEQLFVRGLKGQEDLVEKI